MRPKVCGCVLLIAWLGFEAFLGELLRRHGGRRASCLGVVPMAVALAAH